MSVLRDIGYFFYSQLFITPPPPKTSFAGKTVIVTGANVGLGKEAARHFVELGAAPVILACRNTEAGEAAVEDILKETSCNKGICEVWELDLASYASIRAFAARAERELDNVDVVVENAGLNAVTYKTIGDEAIEGARERTIAINVVGTYLLGLMLFPLLQKTVKKRSRDGQENALAHWVVVASEAHAMARFPEIKEKEIFKALDTEKFFGSDRYATSKLLQVLVGRKIAPLLSGRGVVLTIINPGLCKTALTREFPGFVDMFLNIFARTAAVGARTLVTGAEVNEEGHGKYMTNGVINEWALSSWAKSQAAADAGERVWKELKAILDTIEPGVVVKAFGSD